MQSGTDGWSGLAAGSPRKSKSRVCAPVHTAVNLLLPHRRASDVGVDLSEVGEQRNKKKR
jgi:hypothetical protein